MENGGTPGSSVAGNEQVNRRVPDESEIETEAREEREPSRNDNAATRDGGGQLDKNDIQKTEAGRKGKHTREEDSDTILVGVDSEGSDVDSHDDECEKCGNGGTLLVCVTCTNLVSLSVFDDWCILFIV